ncbi:MAG: lipoate--protein ligase family protein [Muribaculaceae bacterium]|nr:lipoate--protein ligase family protein [Muribaculaceae bacterium]
MKHLALPSDARLWRRLPFYLAAEEWAARTLPPDDYFFAWRVAPTVICGRNQDMQAEVNIAYCREHNIDVVRRRSGGGCVYADRNNWMFSYITPSDDINTTFSRYTLLVSDMLRSLGLDARPTGRNDIVIGGKKVSGNAFYHIPGRSIVHGTMLFDVDMATMANAITPSRAKLESKKVHSVAARVTCLRDEGITADVDAFGRYAVEHICGDSVYEVSDSQLCEIEEIEKTYYRPDFLDGKSQKEGAVSVNTCKEHRHGHIDGVGELDVEVALDDSICIESVNISGDFFVVSELDEALYRHLRGVPFGCTEVRAALNRASCGAIAGLTADNLHKLIFP